ncbi:MAG: redox-sensing transcriptional repressor Rex [Clostridia bacterium]|nr:redox-sensing transcriptional repressor Rex [Clostridia bacterium]MBO7250269.1 redox-sensing transcriptional repressor Rex [Clostridia bacterium]
MAVRSMTKATLGRIPIYIQYLKDLPEETGEMISAPKIARDLSLGEVQVRKDLALISGAGKPKVGYNKEKLIQDLERRLGHDGLTNAVLVGAGKLGRALLDYDGFEEFGIRIIAGFDRNKEPIRIGVDKYVLSIDSVAQYCADHNVKIGIITVGQGSAQEVCDKLIACGVRAVWNFAPCTLTVPEGVLLKQENLALSLAHLNSQTKIKI